MVLTIQVGMGIVDDLSLSKFAATKCSCTLVSHCDPWSHDATPNFYNADPQLRAETPTDPPATAHFRV